MKQTWMDAAISLATVRTAFSGLGKMKLADGA
jgi:hypothetical protein